MIFCISKNIPKKIPKKFLTFFKKALDKSSALCYNIVVPLMNVINNCWCGSMAEHLICNQAVDGSTPFTSSIFGGFPERPKGADCKSVVTDFGGPNPPSPTRKKPSLTTWFFSTKCSADAKREGSFGREVHFVREVSCGTRRAEHVLHA